MAGVYAHRGASKDFPENTLAAFQRALELGVEGIELDVHLSADGHLIVMHDETVDRTTDGTGALAEMTLDQIKTLDAGKGETVPTLGEVLDLVGDRLHVDIEVKANTAGEAVLKELEGRNTRWLISSFKWDVLQYVRSQNAEAELWPLTVGASDDAISIAKEIGAPALAISRQGVDEEIARYLNEQGLDFWVWTVNDPQEAKQFVEWGAIGICTDDPATIQRALAARG